MSENIKDRAALESACKFIEQQVAPRKCDNSGVSGCWRCQSVYLAKRMRELLAAYDVPAERTAIPSQWMAPGAVVPVRPETVATLLSAIHTAAPQGAARVPLSEEQIIGTAEYFFATGENQRFSEGLRYRSLGVPSNVKEADLIEFARAIEKAHGITQSNGEERNVNG
jgi:hypothetical protein